VDCDRVVLPTGKTKLAQAGATGQQVTQGHVAGTEGEALKRR
jgi:hypothetical protein